MNRRASKLSPICNASAGLRTGLRTGLRSGLGAALAVVVLLTCGSRARAQSAPDKKRAQALQVAGVSLLDKGDNRGALQKFEEAFQAFPSPKILFNMGRAHAALGDDVAAVNDFERFLDEAPYAPKQSRDEAEKVVKNLRPKLSYLEIGTDDVGSHISVDGTEVGVAPLARPLAIAPGPHEVRLEKAKMTTETRSVSPVAGQKVRVFVKLRSVADMAAAVAVATPPPVSNKKSGAGSKNLVAAGDDGSPEPRVRDGAGTTPPEHLRETDSAPSSTGSGSGRRALKWVAWGVAAAGVGLGAYGTLRNNSLVNDFDSGCRTNAQGQAVPDPNAAGGGKSASECTSLKSRYESASRLGIGGFIGAGVLTAAGFLFWVTESPASDGRTALASCLPALDAALQPSLTCALRF